MCLVSFGLYADVTLNPERTVLLCKDEFLPLAKPIQEYIELVSGVKPQIVKEAPRGSYVITVGEAPADMKVAYTSRDEGHWLFNRDGAWFFGTNADGIRFAAMDFAENALGIRWPCPGTVCCEKQNPVILKVTSGKYACSLRRQEIRLGNSGYRDYLKDKVAWFNNMRFKSDWKLLSYGHSFTNWWKYYGKTHPEYFALNRGKRAPVSNEKMMSICVSCPGVVSQVIKNWNGGRDYINICENDSPALYACHCDGCRALDPDPNGEFDNNMGADRYVDFGNRVLAEAQKIRPGTKVIYYAYNASEQPPRKTRLKEGTVIGIVPTNFQYSHLTEYVNAWKKAGMKEFVFRPNWHHYFTPMGLPIGYDKFIFRIQDFMIKSGAVGFDYDAPLKFDLFKWRNDYILMHGMIEPERSFEYWEEHYAQAFGGAKEDVMAYFRFWTRIWDERIEKDLPKLTSSSVRYYFSREFFPRATQYYTSEDFVKSRKILEKALSRKMTPAARRVLEDMMNFHEHGALILHCMKTMEKKDILQLVQYRIDHGMEVVQQYDNEFGDIFGLTSPELQEKPYIKAPLLWHFKLDPEDRGIKEEWYKDTDFSSWDGMMPTDSPWEKPVVHEGQPAPELRKKTEAYNGVAWYGCKVRIPGDWQHYRTLLHFGAVDESTEVWVNGKKAGSHPFIKPDDWKTPFDIDITEQVDWTKEEQLITVQVTDNEGAGGIWKPVGLWALEKWFAVDAFPNGGFEKKDNTDGCDGWWNNGAKYHSENPHEGASCMRQRSFGTDWDVTASGTLYKVTPGEKYKLSVWNRNTLNSGSALYGIRYADKNQSTLNGGYDFRRVISGWSKWRKYETVFVIPKDCMYINVYFKVENIEGDVFWDSVILEKAQEAPELKK